MMRSAKYMIFVGLGLFSLTFLGCAFLDSLIGVGKPNEGGDGSAGGSIGVLTGVASVLPGWLGWAGTLLGSGFGFYKTYRERQLKLTNANYSDSVSALVLGIEKALASGTKLSLTKDELYAALNTVKNETMTNPEFLTKLVSEIKGLSR